MINTKRIELKKQNLIMCVKEIGRPNNRPILLLHGFPESSKEWESFAHDLAKDGHYIIIPDLRGFGDSSDNSSLSMYTLHSLAKDIVELLNVSGLKNVQLIGHDWGGVLAWYLNDHYPQSLNGLITISAPHYQIFHNELTHNPAQLLKSFYIFLAQLPLIPEFIFKRTQFKFIKKLLKNSGHPNTSNFDLVWSKNITSMLNWYRALRFYKKTAISKNLTASPCIIYGDSDPFFTPGLSEKALVYYPHAQIHKLKDCGHWPHHEQGDILLELIKKHISS